MSALRMTSALCLAALLFQPGMRIFQDRGTPAQVAVLLDDSASMSLPDGSGVETRRNAMAKLLEDGLEAVERTDSGERASLRIKGFSSGLSASPWQKGVGAVPTSGGAVTDIRGALEEVVASGRDLAGVLLVSDGADNVSFEMEGLSGEDRSWLESLGVPVSTAIVGGGSLKDVSVERVAADDFAFVRSQVSVTAYVRAPGFGGANLPVTLKMDGRPVSARSLAVPAGDGQGPFPVTFTFSPDRTGDFSCLVEIPRQDGEAVPENNAFPFGFKVIRDRVRVLHVAGRPTWDMRFLRGRLKSDPNVDLVSSYILRDLSDDPRTTGDGELSLIPFPMQEVFHDQIHTFDVVILQNFSHEDRSYAMGRYLEGIADYVRGGGALVMVGGENSFGEGRFEDTPIGPLLPVAPTGRPPVEAPFQARLTAAGLSHPITRIAPTAAESRKAWKAVPDVDGVHSTRLKPWATSLLERPGKPGDSEDASLPLVAVGDAREGRVMAVLSDATWQWAFAGADEGYQGRIFERFWSRALRWLVRDQELSPVKVSLDKSVARAGEAVSARVEARNRDYSPAAGAKVSVRLVPASSGESGADGAAVATSSGNAGAGENGTDGAPASSDVMRGNADAARSPAAGEGGSALADGEGIAVVQLAAPSGGAWRVVAEAFQGESPDDLLGRDSVALAARDGGRETSNLGTGEKLMREIALVTGGRAFRQGERLSAIPLKEPVRMDAEEHEDREFPHPWIPLVAMALSLLGEWTLSRRWGHPD